MLKAYKERQSSHSAAFSFPKVTSLVQSDICWLRCHPNTVRRLCLAISGEGKLMYF